MLKRYKKSRDASLIFSVRRDMFIFRLSNLSYNKLEHHHEQGRGNPMWLPWVGTWAYPYAAPANISLEGTKVPYVKS